MTMRQQPIQLNELRMGYDVEVAVHHVCSITNNNSEKDRFSNIL